MDTNNKHMELSTLSKTFVLTYLEKQIKHIFPFLSQQLRMDKDIQLYTLCTSHPYNEAYQSIHFDGPRPIRKNCVFCIEEAMDK